MLHHSINESYRCLMASVSGGEMPCYLTARILSGFPILSVSLGHSSVYSVHLTADSFHKSLPVLS